MTDWQDDDEVTTTFRTLKLAQAQSYETGLMDGRMMIGVPPRPEYNRNEINIVEESKQLGRRLERAEILSYLYGLKQTKAVAAIVAEIEKRNGRIS